MTALPTAIFLLVVALCVLATLRRRRRAAELVVRLRTGLKLAAEAQQHEWRVERRYTDDPARLVHLRPTLQPYLQAKGAVWELSVTDDGSGFDLSVMTGAVRPRGLMPGRSKVLGWRHLLAAPAGRPRRLRADQLRVASVGLQTAEVVTGAGLGRP